MESVAVLNDKKIQPGFIYIRDRQRFYPPKDNVVINVGEIEESPFTVEATEIPLKTFIKTLEENPVEGKLWKNDIDTMVATGQYSLIKCSVCQSKKTLDTPQNVSIDYEYASVVFYQFDILILAKHNRRNRFLISKFSAFFQNFWNSKIDKHLLRNKVQSHFGFKSIKIYYRNFSCQRQGFIPAWKAMYEIVSVFKVICENNNLESYRAIVNKLPQRIKNKSELACVLQKRQSMFTSFYQGILGLFRTNKNESVDALEQIRTFQEIQSIVDTNCNVTFYESSYNCGFDDNIIDKTDGKTDWEGSANNDQTLLTVENEAIMSGCNGAIIQFGVDKCLLERNSAIQVCGERDLIEFDDHVDKNETVKDPPTTVDTNANEPIKSATEPSMLWMENELEGVKTEIEAKKSNSETNNFAIHYSLNNIEYFSEQKRKKDSEIGSPTKQSKHSSIETKKLKFVNESQPSGIKSAVTKSKFLVPCRTEQIETVQHHYYKCSERVGNNHDKITVLLFGSEDRGQLSILNLLWYCYRNDENYQPIVDTSSKIEQVSYYHFGINFKELIVIVTPKLTPTALESLKKNLSDVTLNVNALGFVVNARSETLTSEERNLFNFIRSSFGEVSNHHLMTFITFCDFSRNFPILEEMKNQSIKSTCTFELNNFEADLNKVLLDNLELALISNDLKRGKKICQELKEVPLLSVKSMKIAQEKSFAKSHLESAFQQLKIELNQFVSNVDSEHDLKQNVSPVWKLARLGLALQDNQSSEKALLQFIAKLLHDIPTKGDENLSRCFLLLVFYTPSLNICSSLNVVLRLHAELFKASYIDPKMEYPLSITILKKDNASIYCKCCRDIHDGKLCRRNDGHIAMQCINCKCYENDHSLWTLQDTLNFSKLFCQGFDRILRGQLDNIPKLPFPIDYNIFLNVLLEVFPQYKMLLKTVLEPNK